MSELKPCPFCGNYKGDENNDAPHVCYSQLREAELAHCERCGAEVHTYGKDPRVTWNTRPIEDNLTAELACLKAEYNEEVDQFNAGIEAGKEGKLDRYMDDPYDGKFDVWRLGYEAGSYDRLTEENHALDQINRDNQTAVDHLDEVLADLDNRDIKIAELRNDITAYRRTVLSQKEEIDDLILDSKDMHACVMAHMEVIDRFSDINKRLIENAKRLAGTIFSEEEDGVVIDPSVGCPYCPNGATLHLPSCPITLHCQLMAELDDAK